MRKFYSALAVIVSTSFVASGCKAQDKQNVRATLPNSDNSVLFLGPYSQPTQDDIVIKLNEYDVFGAEPEALLKEITTKGPTPNPKGGTFVARADWNVAWTYKYAQDNSLCTITDISTKLTLTYALPKWQNKQDADPGLVNYWTIFMSSLVEHERGHAMIGAMAKVKIHTAIAEDTVSSADCDVVGKHANDVAYGIINASTADRDYDAITQHGTQQGAQFSVSEAKAMMHK